jgi:hypothetical protein
VSLFCRTARVASGCLPQLDGVGVVRLHARLPATFRRVVGDLTRARERVRIPRIVSARDDDRITVAVYTNIREIRPLVRPR